MTPNHKQFETTLKSTARDALSALSEKERIQFALKIILDTADTRLAASLHFAANRIAEHAEILTRGAGEKGGS